MSFMSRNNSSTSLMGFSVHQPAIGAALQFYPVMGSQQLDDLINAYVPGDADILDKRAAVSMEFFEHSITTGELFKFFMVYPAMGSTSASPASSSAVVDSGYASSFHTSPVMSESQWTNTYSSSQPQLCASTSSSSSKKSASTRDFLQMPGMKIMTKDGEDVTNSASRGCKTKEQRDHAHLMRVLKACDACRRKKTRCDPSHKRATIGSSSSSKVTKKTKTARPAAAPPQEKAEVPSFASEFDQIMAETSFGPASLFPTATDATLAAPSEWDQFIRYDDEPTEAVPYDYNFFLDTTEYFSPCASATYTSSSSTSPAQPITPVQPFASDAGLFQDSFSSGLVAGSEEQGPILPYLNPGGAEAGNNYLDFNLYSPESTSGLDEDLGCGRDISASPHPDYSEYVKSRVQKVDRKRHQKPGSSEDNISNTRLQPITNAVGNHELYSAQSTPGLYSGNDRGFHYRPDADHRHSDDSQVIGDANANVRSDGFVLGEPARGGKNMSASAQGYTSSAGLSLSVFSENVSAASPLETNRHKAGGSAPRQEKLHDALGLSSVTGPGTSVVDGPVSQRQSRQRSALNRLNSVLLNAAHEDNQSLPYSIEFITWFIQSGTNHKHSTAADNTRCNSLATPNKSRVSSTTDNDPASERETIESHESADEPRSMKIVSEQYATRAFAEKSGYLSPEPTPRPDELPASPALNIAGCKHCASKKKYSCEQVSTPNAGKDTVSLADATSQLIYKNTYALVADGSVKSPRSLTTSNIAGAAIPETFGLITAKSSEKTSVRSRSQSSTWSVVSTISLMLSLCFLASLPSKWLPLSLLPLAASQVFQSQARINASGPCESKHESTTDASWAYSLALSELYFTGSVSSAVFPQQKGNAPQPSQQPSCATYAEFSIR
ncbi:hypothetical protein F5Y15DRAFT_416113 [Xylariaceae sp. FL0016]|nr:hypothetical protein F5Y15DRAFT_416113 [Xylariaceae sp. FL0016]